MAGTARSKGAALDTYRRKRNFSKTSEPEGRERPEDRPDSAARLYLIQKHAARALHYDFRLELDGVLKSWAVPKGPSLDPADKRLAMETEDHPVEYGSFEGIIPQGEYGGGTVMLWDRGTWSAEGDPREGYRAGALKFQLQGERLVGGWALVRIRGRERRANGRTWLLVKEKDGHARPGAGASLVETRTTSVATGRDMDAIAADRDARWTSNRTSATARARSPVASFPKGADERSKGEMTSRGSTAMRRAGPVGRAGRGSSSTTRRARGRVTVMTTTRRAAAGSDRTRRARSEASTAPGANSGPSTQATQPVRGSAPTTSARATLSLVSPGGGQGAKRAARRPGDVPGAREARVPRITTPQHPTLVTGAPSGDEWLHEMKFDGYRVLARAVKGKVRLASRSGTDWTRRFPAVAAAVGALGADLLLDGEVAVVQSDGRTSFQALQAAMKEGDAGIVYFVFDLLYWDGFDLTRAPLEARKEALSALLDRRGRAGGVLRYSEHVRGRGAEFFRSACGMALEGVVSKRRDAPYEPGRSRAWLKVKCVHEQEVVVGGYTEPTGSRVGIGALLVGVHDGPLLRYAGKVGTGYTREILEDLRRRLKGLERASSPFEGRVPGAAKARWVSPRLVAQVRFTEWTRDGRLRHPSFEGLRLDKKAAGVVREEPEPTRAATRAATTPGRRATTPRRSARAVSDGEAETRIDGARITHPQRVVYPESGLTKADLARYYASIADRILPHLVDRPLTLVRCPEGIGGDCFYSKHAGRVWVSPALRRVRIREKTKTGEYLIADSSDALLGLVQMGVLEIHTWNSRFARLETPDRIVFDLDPGPGVAWPRVVLAALEIRRRLAAVDLESFLKTSGGKGLHIVVPLTPAADWDACYGFSRAFVEALAAASPRTYVSVMSKAERRGRIFVDYMRNERGATSVAAWSTRARPGAAVSMPVAWEELDDDLRPDTFTVGNVAARLAGLRRDPWQGYARTRQKLPRG